MVNMILRIEEVPPSRCRVPAAAYLRGYEEEESVVPERSRDSWEVSFPLPEPDPESAA
jgi:hypothetical protein